jgi:hypothetical protein
VIEMSTCVPLGILPVNHSTSTAGSSIRARTALVMLSPSDFSGTSFVRRERVARGRAMPRLLIALALARKDTLATPRRAEA